MVGGFFASCCMDHIISLIWNMMLLIQLCWFYAYSFWCFLSSYCCHPLEHDSTTTFYLEVAKCLLPSYFDYGECCSWCFWCCIYLDAVLFSSVGVHWSFQITCSDRKVADWLGYWLLKPLLNLPKKKKKTFADCCNFPFSASVFLLIHLILGLSRGAQFWLVAWLVTFGWHLVSCLFSLLGP